jgi:hypothetical protein
VPGQIGSSCNDGDACTVNDVLDANCNCAGTFQDTDSDGVCDANDNCPTVPGQVGSACDDGNANTINDALDVNCNCVGAPANLDCEGVPNGPAVPGTACNDNNACTVNDVYQPNCTCAGTLQDTDSDGVCDADDNCPTVPGQIGSSCNDGDACTINDVLDANCNCAGTFQDTDSDGVCDANDVCAGGPEPGTPCDDQDANTINDLITPNCNCAGVNVNCTNELDLIFTTDANGDETTWEITLEGGGAPLCSGGPYVSNAVVGADCCLADGCYALRVFDAAGDGMTTGGYVLQTDAGARIIDNRNNFSDGFESAISGGQGFCLPLSTDRVIFTSCDKLDWISGQYVVASPNPAVSAEWVVGGANSVQDANSGYEFWIFDPNGSYSFRRFRSHNFSDGFGPASATRACHMKLNNWTLASQVPANTLMNVRVRSRVNGVNAEFGPACRLMIDPVRAACPLTKLMDIPGNTQFSCGVTRQYGNGNYVYARPVSGANRYQFRFSLPAEGFTVTRTSTNYIMQLNWTGATALQVNKTYDVDVRVSKDGGLTWCTNDTPWGDICLLTIAAPPAGTGNAMMATNNGAAAELRMFPNPNRGDLLTFSLSAVEEGVNTVSVDIFDLFGKRVSARTIAVADGGVNAVLDLNGELAAGMYLVNITAGETLYTERLVIQP